MTNHLRIAGLVGAGVVAVALVVPVRTESPSGIIRFERSGPNGVPFETRGTSRTFTYYKSLLDPRTSAGIWTSPDHTSPMHRQSYTEFIYLLAGSISLTDRAGRQETFRAGDALVIPRGTEFAWTRSDGVEKYWVVFERETKQTSWAEPAAPPTFVRLSADGPTGGLKGEGRTRQHQYYRGADKSSVGVWETAPHTSADFHKTRYAELMIFLSGTTTLSTPTGQRDVFKAGEVALVPRGIDYKWSSDTVRKFWVIFDREPESSTAASEGNGDRIGGLDGKGRRR